MAQDKTGAESSLTDDFKFDDSDDWFNVTDALTKDKPLLSKEVPADFDENDDSGEVHNLEEEKGKPEKKQVEDIDAPPSKKETSTTKVTKEDEPKVEDEPEDKKVKAKKTSKKEDENEDETEDDKPWFKNPDEEVDKTKKNIIKDEVEENLTDIEVHTGMTKQMIERGIFQNIELEEGAEITEDEFYELHEQEINARVDDTITEFFNSFDEDTKDFIKFKKAGGTLHQFLEAYAPVVDLPKEFDAEDATHRDKVIKYHLTTVEKLDGDELEDRLKFIKEGGKEKVLATKWYDKIEEEEKARRESIKKAADKAAEKKAADDKEFAEQLNAVAEETEAVGDIPITKKDKKELGAYINRATVKIGTKYVTPFQAKLVQTLKASTKKDKQNLLAMAKALREDFKFPEVKTKVETKVAKEVQKVAGQKKIGVKAKGSNSSGSKQLSDFFPD